MVRSLTKIREDTASSQIRPMRIGAGDAGPITAPKLRSCQTARTALPPIVTVQTVEESVERSETVRARAVTNRSSMPRMRTSAKPKLDQRQTADPVMPMLSATRGKVDANAALIAHVRRFSVRNRSSGGSAPPLCAIAIAIPEKPAIATANSVMIENELASNTRCPMGRAIAVADSDDRQRLGPASR